VGSVVDSVNSKTERIRHNRVYHYTKNRRDGTDDDHSSLGSNPDPVILTRKMGADMPTAAAAAVSVLAEAGARRFYTVPGESFLEVLEEIDRDERLQLVSVRHESGAAFMAEADSRLSGIPAVALASRGPGATNLSIGVQTAHYDGTPMVVLLGQVESTRLGRSAFQEVDLAAFYAPITKWTGEARCADDIPLLIAQGLRIATRGRPGPVAVVVPADLWDHQVAPPAPWRGELATAEPDPALISELGSALTRARRPVAIVGGGAAAACTEVVAFAERFGVGVYTSFRRQDMFPGNHPHYLGHLGLGTPQDVLVALADADLLVLIGARLDQITSQDYRYPRPGCRVLTVGDDSSRAGGRIEDTVGTTLRALAGHHCGPRSHDWSSAHDAAVRSSTPPATNAELHPAEVVTILQEALPNDVIVTNDAGNFSAFLHRYWRFGLGTVQLGSANGAMGYAVPAAVAAKLVHPERTVVAMVGDGGVLMTGQEIETACRYGAGIIVVVFQNGLYGTIAMHQAKRFGRTAGVAINPVDLAEWARGLGAVGFNVRSRTQLRDVLVAARAERGPVLLAVHTDADIISPAATLSELTGRARPSAAS
jgi:acetolactate synthase-1/2/3 large subunit